MAVWVVAYLATQTIKLPPVMKKIRKALAPVALLAMSFASIAQAHGMPGYVVGGSAERPSVVAAAVRDGISLDEAVRRAEAQYGARVVRTEVQDEDGRKVYVLKLLSEDGRVITVRVDAATGRTR